MKFDLSVFLTWLQNNLHSYCVASMRSCNTAYQNKRLEFCSIQKLKLHIKPRYRATDKSNTTIADRQTDRHRQKNAGIDGRTHPARLARQTDIQLAT